MSRDDKFSNEELKWQAIAAKEKKKRDLIILLLVVIAIIIVCFDFAEKKQRQVDDYNQACSKEVLQEKDGIEKCNAVKKRLRKEKVIDERIRELITLE